MKNAEKCKWIPRKQNGGYVVKSGDTLDQIAQKNNGWLDSIIDWFE